MDESFVRFGIIIFGVSIATRIVAGIFLRDPNTVLFYVGAVTLLSIPFAYYLVFRADYAIFQEYI